MSSLPIISQTMLDVLLERVCIPINYLSTKIDSNTPLWDEPVMMCQQIEKNRFAVESVIQNAKKRNGVFHATNTIRYYHAILCRVYIILYYLHPNDETYQTIVFPSLKKNMGIYNENYLTKINKEIDLIHEQEELIKKVQAEKKKDVKPVFAYVSHSGHEQDHLAIEYNEEQLFRNMSGVIRNLADKYNTRQDEANVWYNAKQVVHTLRDINRPELLINRAASALVYGQLNNGYNGSQIILICAYTMIRSSRNNSHFTGFIKEMENIADASTDLVVIKNSIQTIKNWLDDKLPSDGYDYIGEETTKTETYTNADLKRIWNQIVEQEKSEREKLLKKVEELESSEKALKQQVLSLEKELETEKAKKKAELDEKEQEVEMLTELESTPILKLLWYLMKLDGANVEGHGKKKPAQNIMATLSKIPFDTTKKFWAKEEDPITRQEELIVQINLWMKAIGMKFQF